MSRPTTLKHVLVCTPDLRQGGGVTNYYRTLRLDEIPGIAYFAVNRDGTRSIGGKLWTAALIGLGFLRTARAYAVVHLNPSLNRNSYYRDMAFVWLAARLGRRTLVFFRGWDERFEAKIRGSALQRALFRATYGRATAYVVLGDYFKRRLLGLGVPATTPIHVETTVATSEGGERLDVDDKVATAAQGLRVLFLSRLIREKGIYVAIDAFAACRRAPGEPSMSLHVAGSGPELAAARAYVESRGVEGVVFEGDVAGGRKAALLRDCHVMLFPTFHGEGLPNCILEGMLFGLAIITRPVAAIPEVVRHGVNGWLEASLDPAPFAEALRRLAEDPELLRGMARANRETAVRRFTPEVVRERLRAIYSGLVSGECAA